MEGGTRPWRTCRGLLACGAVRLGALAPDGDNSSHDRWSNEQSDQAKGLQTSEDAEEDPQKGQPGRRADQTRSDKMIGNEYHGGRE